MQMRRKKNEGGKGGGGEGTCEKGCVPLPGTDVVLSPQRAGICEKGG